MSTRTWRRWQPEEDARLRQLAGRRPLREIAADLGRSPRSAAERAHRLGLDVLEARRARGCSVDGVARMLGVNRSRVLHYLNSGALVGNHDSNAWWSIHRADIFDFLRDHPWLYDASKIVDPALRRYVAGLRPERCVSATEAARRLCLTYSGLLKAIGRGDLYAYWIGGRWLVPPSSIRDYQPPPLGGRGVSVERAERRRQTLARMRLAPCSCPATGGLRRAVPLDEAPGE